MKILILTQYFPPEIGAPQNRWYALAQELQSFGASVSVLTAFPNYPKYMVFEAYRGKFYQQESMGGLDVHRSYIYARPRKGVWARLVTYFSFALSSLWAGLFKCGKIDLIVCESPPLFLGWTAVWLKRRHGAHLLFNVSDLWPESAVRLGFVKNKFAIAASRWLEEWIYQNADLISGQTQGILKNIEARFPQKPLFWLKNGVDLAKLEYRDKGQGWRRAHGFVESDVLFYYGGLHGYAQGLDCILEAAAQLRDLPQAKFILLGDGPEKQRLQQVKQDLQLHNVHFFEGVSPRELPAIIKTMDAGVIPLRRLDLFRGAIPSKIFEILGMKKPLLLGLEGEAKELFIEQAQAGWAFEPENAGELAALIRQAVAAPNCLQEKGKNGYRFVCQHFSQKQIARDFWEFIQQN